MAFLSEGVKSPCPRGVLKILVFVLGVKICFFLSEGVSIKMSEGGKIVKINYPSTPHSGAKMAATGFEEAAKQNCPTRWHAGRHGMFKNIFGNVNIALVTLESCYCIFYAAISPGKLIMHQVSC